MANNIKNQYQQLNKLKNYFKQIQNVTAAPRTVSPLFKNAKMK